MHHFRTDDGEHHVHGGIDIIGPAPKSARLTIEAQDGGIRCTSHGENAQGAPIHVEFTAKYDGQDNPVTGSPDFNSIALKRINADTIEATIKKNGMVMG